MAGTLVIDTLKASTGVLATQNGMTGIAKAWVNFDGTNGAIRTAFNVSSVSRTAQGQYTVNFSTSMSDANYAVLGTLKYATSAQASSSILMYQNGSTNTASACYIQSSQASTYYDVPVIAVAVFN